MQLIGEPVRLVLLHMVGVNLMIRTFIRKRAHKGHLVISGDQETLRYYSGNIPLGLKPTST